jgi:hypothetical protein
VLKSLGLIKAFLIMAQCKLTPHEFIQNAFSPMVAVMCSQLVDQTCQKNNLSFVEMIQPFCKLNTEGLCPK